ncbi:centrosomal protein of 19 kDa [Saccopteryx leptura]|uniref:centrosomal protein of 19 kDa n=1 Tax=Saccopteryx leptura TaxID=249018 RepID=UPI00339D15C7
MCTAKKCGIRFQPPAIILIYENETKEKIRQRIMPVRNFSKFSDCNKAAEQLKNNPRHKSYLEQVSLRQLEKLFSFLRGYLLGQSLAETMEQIRLETTIDPEEDLNKLDDKELDKRKSIDPEEDLNKLDDKELDKRKSIDPKEEDLNKLDKRKSIDPEEEDLNKLDDKELDKRKSIDPEEDLNKLDDKELAKRKSIMDELFEKNNKKKDDPGFVYDIEVEFPQDEQLQSCGWDTESADES